MAAPIRRVTEFLLSHNPLYLSFLSGIFISIGANILTALLQCPGAVLTRRGIAPLVFGLAGLAWQSVAVSLEELRYKASVRQRPDVNSLRGAMYEAGGLSEPAFSALWRMAASALLTWFAFYAIRWG